MCAERLARSQAALVGILAHRCQRGRIQLEGLPSLPQRQQFATVQYHAGIGGVAGRPEHVPQETTRNLRAHTAIQDFLRCGLVDILGGAYIAILVMYATALDSHRTDHAVAIKPVTILLLANLVPARTVQKQGALQPHGNFPDNFLLADPVGCFVEQGLITCQFTAGKYAGLMGQFDFECDGHWSFSLFGAIFC